MPRSRLDRPARPRMHAPSLRTSALVMLAATVWAAGFWAFFAAGEVEQLAARASFFAAGLSLGAVAAAWSLTDPMLRATLAGIPALSLIPVAGFAWLARAWMPLPVLAALVVAAWAVWAARRR